MKYTHLIISRVNIKIRPQDDSWISARLDILNNTLRPSLEAQTNQNFKFITLWGHEPVGGIPNEYQLRFDAVNSQQELFIEILPKITELIDNEYVLVTRVDSDNCLGEKFVETIQDNITENVPFYYDIKKMDVINTKTRNKSFWVKDKTSGFITVMEKSDEFTCIPYKYSHGQIGDKIDGMTLNLDVLLTIHGYNLLMKDNIGKPSDFDVSKYNLVL